MKIDEGKLIEFLESHLGENTRTLDLAKICGIYKEGVDFQIDLKTDAEIRRIASENGYRLNADHHADEEIGMPWAIDFFIEDGNVERDIKRINEPFQLKMKKTLIEMEYGIYDDHYGNLIGFRLSIPGKIKMLYDELNNEIDELEADGRIID